MKLDKMQFARVLAHCISNGMSAGDYEITELDNLIDVPMPEVKAGTVPAADVDQLLALMFQGTEKISAIKSYRNLTGAYLKDAKDAVERHWVSKADAYVPRPDEY